MLVLSYPDVMAYRVMRLITPDLFLQNGQKMSDDVGMEDADEIDDCEDEDDFELGVEQSTPEKRARHAITGRGVTLQMLMADGIIIAGEGLLSLEYLGQKFTADLLPNGKIKSNETDQIFGSPSSWAIFCKKLVNPAKKSGCGWASVKYKGRKLDSWKTSWFWQQKPRNPHVPGSQSPVSSNISSEITESCAKPKVFTEICSKGPEISNDIPLVDQVKVLEEIPKHEAEISNNMEIKDEPTGVLDLTIKPKKLEPIESQIPVSEGPLCYIEVQEEALNLSMKKATSTSQPTDAKHNTMDISEVNKNDRIPLHYSALAKSTLSVDQNQLVLCEKFSNLGKFQPYTVSMSTNSLLLMDFHCHLTTSEVAGYLGGKWDQSTQHLSVQQTFPCRCRLGDSQNATEVEEEIRSKMKHLGMSLVGWYHSHPYCLPEPSLQDIECQMAYQLKMKGAKSTYFPCIGMINSPYYGKSLVTESSIEMFMVMPAPEMSSCEYGLPMSMKYSIKQNHSISEELLCEMKKMVDFYRGAPDWISFQHSWHPGVTYLEKLMTSIGNKLPEDQMSNGTFQDYVRLVLTS